MGTLVSTTVITFLVFVAIASTFNLSRANSFTTDEEAKATFTSPPGKNPSSTPPANPNSRSWGWGRKKSPPPLSPGQHGKAPKRPPFSWWRRKSPPPHHQGVGVSPPPHHQGGGISPPVHHHYGWHIPPFSWHKKKSPPPKPASSSPTPPAITG